MRRENGCKLFVFRDLARKRDKFARRIRKTGEIVTLAQRHRRREPFVAFHLVSLSADGYDKLFPSVKLHQQYGDAHAKQDARPRPYKGKAAAPPRLHGRFRTDFFGDAEIQFGNGHGKIICQRAELPHIGTDDSPFPFGNDIRRRRGDRGNGFLPFALGAAGSGKGFAQPYGIETACVRSFALLLRQKFFQRYTQRRGKPAQHRQIRFADSAFPFGNRLQVHAERFRQACLRQLRCFAQFFQSFSE